MEQIELDNTDLRLLHQLQVDASLSNLALAELVHVSAPTCLRRVKRLVEAGLIERQVAILSADRLAVQQGHGLTAIVEITLDRQDEERLAAFELRVAADAAVQQCYRVSPGPDFVLVVCVPDMDGYQAFARRLLSGDAHVRNVRSYFVTQRAKMTTQLPV